MRILIYGAGVIGSLYGALLAQVGQQVSLLARGRRLAKLREKGLLYRDRHGKIHRAAVSVLDTLAPDDCYDFIFVTVRAEQLHEVLCNLRENVSPTIVTMVNSIEPYAQWEELCGRGRLLPAFPGAGGGIEDGILDAALTPRLVQPTTFGEIGGGQTARVMELKQLLQSAGIPCRIVPDMHLWQICHLGLVVPLADAYYKTADPARVWQDGRTMRETARQLRKNFRLLYRRCGHISPGKLHLLRLCPAGIVAAILSAVYKSRFGDRFMYRHAMKAPGEMARLHEAFYGLLKGAKTNDQ